LSYLADTQTDRQTNKQTKSGKNITFLAEVKSRLGVMGLTVESTKVKQLCFSDCKHRLQFSHVILRCRIRMKPCHLRRLWRPCDANAHYGLVHPLKPWWV